MPIHLRDSKCWKSRAVARQAAVRAKVGGAVSLHLLRCSFARHLVEGGADIRYVRKLLKHRFVKTAEAYVPIIKVHGHRVKSPLDPFL